MRGPIFRDTCGGADRDHGVREVAEAVRGEEDIIIPGGQVVPEGSSTGLLGTHWCVIRQLVKGKCSSEGRGRGQG